MSKIIGVTVGTPTSPAKIEQELKPVKTVNGVAPDENGNVNVRDSIHALYVTATAESTDEYGTWCTADKTMAEIIEEYSAGRSVILRFPHVGDYLLMPMVYCTNTAIGFCLRTGKESIGKDGDAVWEALMEDDDGFHVFRREITASGSGESGKDGVTFTPSVSASGVLSWTNDGGLKNPSSVNIKGKDGENGTNGYSVLIMDVFGSNYSNVSHNRFSTTPKVGDLAITNDGYLYKVVSSMFETMTYGVELVANLNGATGPQGDPGDAYVLTEADKQTIAELAAGLVDVPGGGGGMETVFSLTTTEDTSSIVETLPQEVRDKMNAASLVTVYLKIPRDTKSTAVNTDGSVNIKLGISVCNLKSIPNPTTTYIAGHSTTATIFNIANKPFGLYVITQLCKQNQTPGNPTFYAPSWISFDKLELIGTQNMAAGTTVEIRVG